MNPHPDLAKLATAVAQSAKYRTLPTDLIHRVAAEELAKRSSYKEALKSSKNKLHQIGGAYWQTAVDFPKALARLQQTTDLAGWQQTSQELMQLHTSTKERLPILAPFYHTIFAHLPPIQRVIDVACGLNPLALPWMALPAGASYHAYDIYGDMMQFLQQYFELAAQRHTAVVGQAHHQDVISTPPQETADLAIILKSLPCLEQSQRGAAKQLLDTIQARYLLVSYPAQSLGGRHKGMPGHYEAQFAELVNGRGWHITPFTFATELLFLVQTDQTI